MSNDNFYPSELKETGKTLEEIKEKLIKKYGGDNFSIVNKELKLTPGFLGLGFFQKSYLEVTYFVKNRFSANRSSQSFQSSENQSVPQDDFKKNRDALLKSVGVASLSAAQLAALVKQFDEFQKNQKALDSKIDKLTQINKTDSEHASIQKIEELLQENEFTFSYVNKITSRIRSEFSIDKLDDFDAVQKTVVDWIGQSIKVAAKKKQKLPQVIVLVGPTGVGKTTTISKFAANYILDAKNKQKPRPRIQLVTIDRTRVGAEEQIRHFGEIMSVSVSKAETAKDVQKIFEEYKNSLDYMLIDTAGYSPNDFESIAKMRAILEVPGLHPDIFLAVSASTKANDLERIIQNYEVFNFNSVIVTKCDETCAYGNIISVLSDKNKSISYITDGQKVPKNIRRASVVEFLKNLNDFKVDREHIEDLFPGDD